jgi:hypothetical protein
VLSLDADYFLSDGLIAELCTFDLDRDIAGYSASFRYCVFGKPLRGSLYPARTVLYRRGKARYVNEGHTQRVRIDGPVGRLNGVIFHDDRKPLSRWVASQQRYAALESRYLLEKPRRELRRTDRIRLAAWPAPFLVAAYTLFFKGCILDGWQGWYYALQRVLAEVLIALEIVTLRRKFRSGL